jgi:RimJ/RimL family protein N-acetyltransferase
MNVVGDRWNVSRHAPPSRAYDDLSYERHDLRRCPEPRPRAVQAARQTEGVTHAPRLELGRPTKDDLDDYIRLWTDPEIARWLRPPPLPPYTEENVERILWEEGAHWDEHGFGPWILHHDGEFAGRGGLGWTVVNDEPVVEIMWAIVPPLQNRGLGTQTALLAIDYARGIGLSEVVAFTLPTNKASERVMQKAGMEYAGRTMHADLPHVLYRLAL